MVQTISKSLSVSALLALLALASQLVRAQPASPTAAAQQQPQGTVCSHFVLSSAPDDVPVITCKGIGKVKSVAELYERGYRVVTATQATGTGQGVVFIYIEERK